jgi:hypothetical protein
MMLIPMPSFYSYSFRTSTMGSSRFVGQGSSTNFHCGWWWAFDYTIANSRFNWKINYSWNYFPFTNFFNIQSSQPIDAFELRDTHGKLILQENKLNQTTITINLEVSPGFYHLKVIQSDCSISYHKLIKAKD